MGNFLVDSGDHNLNKLPYKFFIAESIALANPENQG